MMIQTATIRQKLHQYVEQGDERLMKLMYALAKEYNENEDDDYIFKEEDIHLFDERSKKRSTGESKVYDWKEAMKMIVSKNEQE
jgi:phosphoribosylanthranilate isomerase